MTNQSIQTKPFLERVVDQSQLKSTESAQMATKVMFRILRDMMPTEEVNELTQTFRETAPDGSQQVADLWADPNVMVAFFSRVSPLRPLTIGYQTAMLRLEQEGGLPDTIKPEKVAMAIFSATKAELSQDRQQAIAQFLPSDGLRQMWEQA